jgi:hypothetical protein
MYESEQARLKNKGVTTYHELIFHNNKRQAKEQAPKWRNKRRYNREGQSDQKGQCQRTIDLGEVELGWFVELQVGTWSLQKESAHHKVFNEWHTLDDFDTVTGSIGEDGGHEKGGFL